MKTALVLALAGALSGCQMLQNAVTSDASVKLRTVAVDDLRHALQIATDNNDLVAMSCLQQLLTGAEFLQRSGMGAQGAFTTLEVARVIRRNAQIQDCAAVVAAF